jgi:hypothetical protein
MKNDTQSYSCLLGMAERELGAFMNAVAELYGPEQATNAADDWINEFESADEPLDSTSREWRKITVKAAARLASRLLESGHNPTRVREINAVV